MAAALEEAGGDGTGDDEEEVDAAGLEEGERREEGDGPGTAAGPWATAASPSLDDPRRRAERDDEDGAGEGGADVGPPEEGTLRFGFPLRSSCDRGPTNPADVSGMI